MNDVYHEEEWEEIISVQATLEELKIKLELLIDLVNDTQSSLIVFPRQAISIGLRFPRHYRPGIFDRTGENPLRIDIGKVDGFIPSHNDIEKILLSGEWGTSTPVKVATANPTRSRITASDPYHLALKSPAYHALSGKHYHNHIDDYIWPYHNHELYFKDNDSTTNTTIALSGCFLLRSDLASINKRHHALYGPKNYDQVGDYQINKWSNMLIRDLHAVHWHLYHCGGLERLEKNSINPKTAIKIWINERWQNNKNVTRECLEQAPHLCLHGQTPSNHDISLEGFSKERLSRNKGVPDLLKIIDIFAERYISDQRGYNDSESCYDSLNEIGVQKKTLQQAIYSIIKAEPNNKYRNKARAKKLETNGISANRNTS
ncbi:hypothetical protein [Ectothiorhodospira haloalkaliphila]|uniref:hypothetical protein n=1 Tax=Ectothiorhodospira haloalkaliphila TaxID=421628 RepID=UPI0012EB88AC|nr:hypothetical protein [Ectothiorhodospira haloalkaliphila]